MPEKLTDITLDTLLHPTAATQGKFEGLRKERLWQQCGAEIPALLHVDLDENLHIHCTAAGQADELLAIESQLKEQIYLVMGIRQASIWYMGEQVWNAPTRSLPEGCELPRLSPEELDLITTEILQETPAMATATLEATTNPTEIIDKAAEEAIVPAVSQMVGDRLQAYFTGEAFAVLVRSEVEKQVAQAISKFQSMLSGTMQNGKVEAETEVINVTPAASSEPASAEESDHLSSVGKLRLKMPRGIRNRLTKNNPRNNLQRALPMDVAEQQVYLEAIAAGLENGKAWLMQLVDMLNKEYGLEIDSTYATYSTSAKKLLQKLKADAASQS